MAISNCAVCNKTISANKITCNQHSTPVPTGDGVLEILNVGAGDVKITFNNGDIQETIRARRIVTDMLRRGYALIVEVEREGRMAYERVQAFDEAKGEYIIADLDPAPPITVEVTATADTRKKCPRCGSPDPEKHPAVQLGGEVQPCSDPFHGIKPDLKGTPAEPDPKLRTCSRCGKPKHRGRCSRSIPMEKAKATAVGRSAGG